VLVEWIGTPSPNTGFAAHLIRQNARTSQALKTLVDIFQDAFLHLEETKGCLILIELNTYFP
jgi:hypothetical protein